MQSKANTPLKPGEIISFQSAATLERPQTITLMDAQFGKTIKATKNKSGGALLKGMRIFKRGTFKDSMGYERTWEDAHLEQMVFHFKLLRDGGNFPNVPLRVDHSFSANSVVGYLADVYRDEDDDQFLASDVEITEPDAYAKWERGTYRSRSLEVGMYETNDGAMYWPVVMGLAFVDIPAVEGLHRAASHGAHFFFASADDTKETSVSENTNGGAAGGGTQDGGAGGGQPQPTATPAPAAPSTTETAGGDGATAGGEGAGTAASNGGGGAPAAGGSQAQHAASQVHTFTVNGQPTQDFGAVQRHIATLEQFRADTIETGRKAFVAGLAEANKISATQIDDLTDLALGMNDEQYAKFCKSYDAAPTSSLFAQHGAGGEGGGGTGGGDGGGGAAGGQSLTDQIEVLEETIAQHKRAGMSQEKIEKTSSFQRLQALKAQRGTA